MTRRLKQAAVVFDVATLLDRSCGDAKSGKMPGSYTFFKPETRLSAQDVETICAAVRETEVNAAGDSQ